MPIRGSPNGPRHFSPHCSQPLAPRGHFGLERVVTIDWKQWSPSIGTGGHHAPVRAANCLSRIFIAGMRCGLGSRTVTFWTATG